MLRIASKIGTGDQHPDPPRWGNSSEPQIRQIFQDVDGSDLEALKSLCVQWEVDLSASMAEQNARIDQGSIDANSVAPSTRRKWASCATASSARWSPPGSDLWYAWVTAALLWRCSAASISATWMMPDGLMDA